jgi:hypothetical protein
MLPLMSLADGVAQLDRPQLVYLPREARDFTEHDDDVTDWCEEE